MPKNRAKTTKERYLLKYASETEPSITLSVKIELYGSIKSIKPMVPRPLAIPLIDKEVVLSEGFRYPAYKHDNTLTVVKLYTKTFNNITPILMSLNFSKRKKLPLSGILILFLKWFIVENFKFFTTTIKTELFLYNEFTPFSMKRCMVGMDIPPINEPIVAENMINRKIPLLGSFPFKISVSTNLVSNGAWNEPANCEISKIILNNELEEASFLVRIPTILVAKQAIPIKFIKKVKHKTIII